MEVKPVSVSSSQSKRAPKLPRDGDSHPGTTTTSSAAAHPHRQKRQKHVVGGSGGRLHARVPSSKALHKHAHKEPTAAAPPQPSQAQIKAQTPAAQRPSVQRRVTAEATRSCDSPSTNLRENISQPHLKRNSRSQVDVCKKHALPPKLKRFKSQSKIQEQRSQVHFDLGNEEDDDDDDDDDDEWVDASSSASLYLSRRTSAASASSRGPNPIDSAPGSAQLQQQSSSPGRVRPPASCCPVPASETSEHATPADKKLIQRNQRLATHVTQNIPSHNTVPPQMSSDTVDGPMSPHSSEQGFSRGSSTPTSTPQTSNTLPNSARDERVSSQFIHGSAGGGGNDGSFYTPTDSGAHDERRNYGNSSGSRRPQSVGSLAHGRRGERSLAENDKEKDRERVGRLIEGGISRGRSRNATAAESSRTQQKIDLMRASSTLEPNPVHSGNLADQKPLITGGNDPRAGKILDRTGMEYLVVRRYQNPVARSISRLKQLPAAERSKRIPVQAPTRQSTGNSRMSGTPGPAQSFSAASEHIATGQSRPTTPHKNAGGPTLGAEASLNSHNNTGGDELGGSSLLESGDDDTAALLRSLWDRRMDFASASQ